MKTSRRIVLRGLGGATLGLPLLESWPPAPRYARAQAAPTTPTFAIFFRQANGVAQAQNNGDTTGNEPERFFPTTSGPLTQATMTGRAVGELVAHASRLLILRNVNYQGFDYNDGHANGALQALTARGPTVAGAAGNSEAAGESIDHRIGRELNTAGRDSLFLYAGATGGWLGGPCISYRGPAQRRAATNNPYTAYTAMIGGAGGMTPQLQMELVNRRKSVNDLLRTQLQRLMGSQKIGGADKKRLQLHIESIRDLELTLTCNMTADEERTLMGAAPGFNSTDGDQTLKTARLHMQVSALAVACGYTRSAAIQVGSGNDGATRYKNLETGQLMENYHYISHRRLSHGSDGAVIPGSDLLHHFIDRQFAQTFKSLLDRLVAYTGPDGKPLLDAGVAIWYNDNSNGPPHGRQNVPWILAGSAGGYFKQGQYADAEPTNTNRAVNLHKLLNTLGTALGVKNAAGTGPLDDFGDPSLGKGVLPALKA